MAVGVGRRADDVDRRSSAWGRAARNASIRALTASAGVGEPHDLHAGDARRRVDDGPARRDDRVGARSPSPREFAQRAGGEVDLCRRRRRCGRACRRESRSRRRWRCGPPSRRAGRRRRRRPAPPSRRRWRRLRVGEAEVAPGEKGGEVGFEILAAQRRPHAVGAAIACCPSSSTRPLNSRGLPATRARQWSAMRSACALGERHGRGAKAKSSASIDRMREALTGRAFPRRPAPPSRRSSPR